MTASCSANTPLGWRKRANCAAPRFARQAIARNAEDGWRRPCGGACAGDRKPPGRGHQFLKELRPAWSKAHALSVHNGWHLRSSDRRRALCRSPQRSTTAYRRAENPGDGLLDLVDASAVLWRLELAGANVGERWSRSPRNGDACRRARARLNDLHIALAISRAETGRRRTAAALARRLRAPRQGRQQGLHARRRPPPDRRRARLRAGRLRATVEAILPVRYKSLHRRQPRAARYRHADPDRRAERSQTALPCALSPSALRCGRPSAPSATLRASAA